MTALLIGTYERAADKHICEEHLEELRLLVETYGMETVAAVPCTIRGIDAATYLGSGKLEELQQIALSHGVDTIIFDDELASSQQRNLEKFFGITVLERTEVILGVFAKHAHTKEAQLQISLAQVQYNLPRLKRLWTHLERQRGGGLALRGMGEKQIEVDRRLLETRATKLSRDLEEVRQHRDTQRARRQRTGIPTFAIVGYTNAGKSTLLNKLTDAEVLVEDQLFATLDTTTRKFELPNNQEILLIDTVGFIRKLPHQLVEAFKSTLEEAVYADILIHLIDASAPMAHEQAEATMEVLHELNADNRPMITVLNKVDQIEDPSMLSRLRMTYTKTVPISAKEGTGLDDLLQAMIGELARLRKEVKLLIPQSDYAVVTEIHRIGEIFYQEYEGNDILIRARIPVEALHKVEPYLLAE